VPSAITPSTHRPPAPSATAPSSAPLPLSFDDYEPRSIGDLERQADDIIANFRARHQTGLDKSSMTSYPSSPAASAFSSLSPKTYLRDILREDDEEMARNRQMRQQAN